MYICMYVYILYSPTTPYSNRNFLQTCLSLDNSIHTFILNYYYIIYMQRRILGGGGGGSGIFFSTLFTKCWKPRGGGGAMTEGPEYTNVHVYNAFNDCVTEAAKRRYFFNGSAIKSLPPPLELNGSRNFFSKLKKRPKKHYFFLILSLLPSPPS